MLKELASSAGTTVENFEINMDELFDRMDDVVKKKRPSLSKEINLIHKFVSTVLNVDE